MNNQSMHKLFKTNNFYLNILDIQKARFYLKKLESRALHVAQSLFD